MMNHITYSTISISFLHFEIMRNNEAHKKEGNTIFIFSNLLSKHVTPLSCCSYLGCRVALTPYQYAEVFFVHMVSSLQ
jgi:hypothetical protein